MSKKIVFYVNLCLLFISLLILSGYAQTGKLETRKGKLVVGEKDSAIIYYGSESGDLAAFCFRNKSAAGRAILGKCKDGELCQFTGQVSFNSTVCSTAYELTQGYSFTGEIVFIKSVKKIIK
jgi:hypothetical protein